MRRFRPRTAPDPTVPARSRALIVHGNTRYATGLAGHLIAAGFDVDVSVPAYADDAFTGDEHVLVVEVGRHETHRLLRRAFASDAQGQRRTRVVTIGQSGRIGVGADAHISTDEPYPTVVTHIAAVCGHYVRTA